MMETQEILRLLQNYFDGNTSEAEEQQIYAYFQSGEVAEELAEYTEFFWRCCRVGKCGRRSDH